MNIRSRKIFTEYSHVEYIRIRGVSYSNIFTFEYHRYSEHIRWKYVGIRVNTNDILINIPAYSH